MYDIGIARTTTDVPRNPRFYFIVTQVSPFRPFYQSCSTHNHSRGAVAALKGMRPHECFLYILDDFIIAIIFYCRYYLAMDARC